MNQLLIRLKYYWQRHGVRGLPRLLMHNAVFYSRRLKNFSFRKKEITDPFDGQYGTDTSGLIPIRSLGVLQNPNAVYAGAYLPSSVPQVSGLIKDLDIDTRDFTFIDYGSGKGRVLLVAAQFPFKEVIGVEFSPQLHQIALRNIAVFPVNEIFCGSVKSVLGDAGSFVLPASDLVCFFYDPFGPEVLVHVLERFAAHIESGYRIIVIYINPNRRAVFDQSGLFTVLKEVPARPVSPGVVVMTSRPASRSSQDDDKPRETTEA